MKYKAENKLPVYKPSKTFYKTQYSRIYILIDGFFVLIGLILSVWFAIVLLLSGLSLTWDSLLVLIAFWVVLTYLALPRFHQIFTTFYTPDYFMARAKTGDGLVGDPINLSIVGGEKDIHYVMQKAGWSLADKITLRSVIGIIRSSLTKKSYPEAPVSDLYLFGKKQDFAYQLEVGGSASRRHHVRFWKVPEDWGLPGGKKVDYLAAGTFDCSIGFSTFTLQVTHKIDSDIDAERDFIINNILFSDPKAQVDVLKRFSASFHDRNGGGDRFYTDGNMPILNLRDSASRLESQGFKVELEKHKYKHKKYGSKKHVHQKELLDYQIPPTSLRILGFALVLHLISSILFYLFEVFIKKDLWAIDYVEFSITIVVSILAIVLYVMTLRHFGWARLILLTFISISTTYFLYTVTIEDSVTFSLLIQIGLMLIATLSLSAPSVRKWVSSFKGRSGFYKYNS